jgi:hypothetical protein
MSDINSLMSQITHISKQHKENSKYQQKGFGNEMVLEPYHNYKKYNFLILLLIFILFLV